MYRKFGTKYTKILTVISLDFQIRMISFPLLLSVSSNILISNMNYVCSKLIIKAKTYK